MGNQNSTIQNIQKFMLVWHITAPPPIFKTSYTSADFHSLVDPPDEKIFYWFLRLIVSPLSDTDIINVKLQVNTCNDSVFGGNIATTRNIYLLDGNGVLQHVLQPDKISRIKPVLLKKCSFIIELDFPCSVPPVTPVIWISSHTFVFRERSEQDFGRFMSVGQKRTRVCVNNEDCLLNIDNQVSGIIKIEVQSIPRLCGLFLHFDGCSNVPKYTQISQNGTHYVEHKCSDFTEHRVIDITTYNYVSFEKMDFAAVSKISSAIIKGVPEHIQYSKETEVFFLENKLYGTPNSSSAIKNNNEPEISTESSSRAHKNPVYYQFLKDNQFCDITINTYDVKIRAHKVLLAGDSTVWRQLFLKNETLDVLTIYDLDKITLNAVIEFIYTGSVAQSLELNEEQLLTAADKYGIDGLKERCVTILTRTISMETAANLLILAQQNNALTLLNNVLSFIRNNFEKFKTRKEFDTLFLTYPDLGLMIMKV